ncbi:GNAT family N-acetyltransferase [Desulfogranum japonicum]|uniref:GNAT family N-acetyltransferase n=1 Tax=Desulfogranum japonicum TaxID=231447 RepID=UPI000411608A|nr:GNAT family N-acetyltransferase [Desulfogranum japonicum]
MWKPYLCHDTRAWDAYVSSHPELSPFLRYSWSSIIKNSYDHQPYFLALPSTGSSSVEKFSSILPLIYFHPPDGINRLISLPYLDCAGIFANDYQSFSELLNSAFALARDLEVAHVELRQDALYPLAIHDIKIQGWEHRSFDFKVGLRRFLPQCSTVLWQQLGSKVRNQVRKAEKNSCTSQVGGKELLDSFYQIFGTNMRDLGSPVHSYDFFIEIFKAFGESVRIILVERQGVPLASSIVLTKGNTLYNPWASSLRAYRPLCPNMLLYWTMLSWACDQGLSCFDFGRSSPGASTYTFKKQWGAESRPLSWEVFSLPGQEWYPEKESLNLKGWNTLTLAESNTIGPKIRRWISL